MFEFFGLIFQFLGAIGEFLRNTTLLGFCMLLFVFVMVVVARAKNAGKL